MSGYLRIEQRGPVLIATLDGPGTLNTYDGPGLHAIGALRDVIDANSDIRVAVITGAGDEFCAGADIAAASGGGFSDPPYPEVAEGLADKPVIAAIEGRCLGGGMMIAAGADLRIAGRSARFGLPEARWNLPAQWLGALGRQLLAAHTLELALLADEQLGAERLREMGWLNRVVEKGDALEFALGWADRLAGLAPTALRYVKTLTRRAAWDTPEETLTLGHRQAAHLITMDDTVEGGIAFVEGRPPRFEGR